jgi:DNA repair protein RecN (Recombination protein N)
VELRIENLLLITSAEIEFSAGFNALTGETGAGKSLLLDALDFLLGARGDVSMVRTGADQAEVSARVLLQDRTLVEHFAESIGIVFDIPTESVENSAKKMPIELVLSRALPRNGRARAYANGRPIALPALRWLGEHLLDVHGQHENQSLLRPATRLEILDRFANAQALAETVRHAYSHCLDTARELSKLRRAARDRQGREDLLRFQLKELIDARLDELEPASLEGEVRLLRGAEKIRAAALNAYALIENDEDGGAATYLVRALKGFHGLGEAGPEATALQTRLENLLSELREAASDADDLAEKARSDPERLADLEDRRQRLRMLERKHGRDLTGLVELRQTQSLELERLQHIDIRTQQQEQTLANAIAELRKVSEKLSLKRLQSARELEKCVSKELADLGLKGAKLQLTLIPHNAAPSTVTATSNANPPATASLENDVAIAEETVEELESRKLIPNTLRSTGSETAELLFSANAGVEARPLKDCASGGEMSRVMLSIKTVLARVSGADRLPVVVFDEIDAGVGGRLGAVLGKKLRDLAGVRQVLCITHQPQIAAYAHRQLKVSKRKEGQSTVATVKILSGEQQIAELAQMLRGDDASDHTRKEAAAMLKEAQKE